MLEKPDESVTSSAKRQPYGDSVTTFQGWSMPTRMDALRCHTHIRKGRSLPWQWKVSTIEAPLLWLLLSGITARCWCVSLASAPLPWRRKWGLQSHWMDSCLRTEKVHVGLYLPLECQVLFTAKSMLAWKILKACTMACVLANSPAYMLSLWHGKRKGGRWHTKSLHTLSLNMVWCSEFRKNKIQNENISFPNRLPSSLRPSLWHWSFMCERERGRETAKGGRDLRLGTSHAQRPSILLRGKVISSRRY